MIYFIQIYDCAFYLSSIPVEDAYNFFLKTVNNLWGNWEAKKQDTTDVGVVVLPEWNLWGNNKKWPQTSPPQRDLENNGNDRIGCVAHT